MQVQTQSTSRVPSRKSHFLTISHPLGAPVVPFEVRWDWGGCHVRVQSYLRFGATTGAQTGPNGTMSSDFSLPRHRSGPWRPRSQTSTPTAQVPGRPDWGPSQVGDLGGVLLRSRKYSPAASQCVNLVAL